MKLLYDVENSRWYNENGESFNSGNPAIPYGNAERVEIQLYSEVEGTNSGSGAVADWKKYTGFSGGGYGAVLATDNNFLHWFKTTLQTALSAGELAVTTLIDVATGVSVNDIAESGNIYLYTADGSCEAVAYASREAISGGIRFTPASGNVLANAYSVGAQTDVPEMLYAEATMVAAASDPATGLFVFDFICDSVKLRNKMQYSSIEQVDDCKGLELTVFQTHQDNTVSIRKRFRCSTFRITGGIADIKTGVPVPVPEQNQIAAVCQAMLSAGFSVQIYSVENDTWSDYDPATTYTRDATLFRFRLAESSAPWSVVPIIAGADGEDGEDAPNMKIQYSADGVSFHDTLASSDLYIRFSTDNGATWSSGIQFVGKDAPNIQIEYSVSGGSGSWHETRTADDHFIRFSADGGTTWTGAMQVVAYAVKYAYGSTATATFHADYVAGVDKYFKTSSDNGATWSAAILFAGQDGQSFVPNATGTYADRDNYDTESKGFAYLVTSGTNAGKIYFKTADTSGSWSDGLQFTPLGVSLQYSADGTSWHTTQASADYYVRFSTDGGSTWSAGSVFRGSSAYCYYAYASDTSGNDFSLTAASGLRYRNEIHTSDELAETDLTQAKFAADGIGWYLYLPQDGTTYDWLSGTTVPASSLGKNGDWYIRTDTSDVYLKTSGAWVLKMNIKGPTGAGVTVRGTWNVSTSYAQNDMVSYLGNAYIAVRANSGVTPGTSSADWTLYIQRGPQGDPGEPLDANYVDVTSLSSGYIVLDDDTVPTSVEISGVVYDIENGWIVHDTVNGKFKIPAAPLLAAANLASFSGTWRVWRAGGKKGQDGQNGGTFAIQVVNSLPENPSSTTLYLIPEV